VIDVAIVIAARNEADNIGNVVRAARTWGSVIVVDNASTDGTADEAWAAGADVISHEQDTHIKQSYVDGFKRAARRFPFVVQMDAGKSHHPEEIRRLLMPLRAGIDMTIGSRFVAGSHLNNQGLRRRLLSVAGSALVRRRTGMPIRDLTSGFKAYRCELLQALDDDGVLDGLKARAHAFQFELTHAIWKRGATIWEVPITYTATGSSVDLRVIAEALRTLWLL